jgi:hypothetical protein
VTGWLQENGGSIQSWHLSGSQSKFMIRSAFGRSGCSLKDGVYGITGMTGNQSYSPWLKLLAPSKAYNQINKS